MFKVSLRLAFVAGGYQFSPVEDNAWDGPIRPGSPVPADGPEVWMVPMEIESDTSYEAEYTLETPIACPQCKGEISSVHVVRLLRNRINFTSTLPRRGHVILCGSCRTLLSANLGGI